MSVRYYRYNKLSTIENTSKELATTLLNLDNPVRDLKAYKTSLRYKIKDILLNKNTKGIDNQFNIIAREDIKLQLIALINNIYDYTEGSVDSQVLLLLNKTSIENLPSQLIIYTLAHWRCHKKLMLDSYELLREIEISVRVELVSLFFL